MVKRSQTRGMRPELRHRSETSVMLCRLHHGLHETGLLVIEALTARGADGLLRFRHGAAVYTEVPVDGEGE